MNRWPRPSSKISIQEEQSMANEFAQIEVKRQGKETFVLGIGRTPKGQRYIKARELVDTKGPQDPDYKLKIETAIAKLYAE